MIKTKKLLLEAICFEHWARFHFLEEVEGSEAENENIVVHLPEIMIKNCEEDVPHLLPLLNKIQNNKISLEHSRDYIFDFLLQDIETDPEEFVKEINKMVNNTEFSRFLDVFNTFVQEEAEATLQTPENVEDEQIIIPTYLVWLENFRLWAKERNLDDALKELDCI